MSSSATWSSLAHAVAATPLQLLSGFTTWWFDDPAAAKCLTAGVLLACKTEDPQKSTIGSHVEKNEAKLQPISVFVSLFVENIANC